MLYELKLKTFFINNTCCDFLPNWGNITPFVRWNKQEKRARSEMHFSTSSSEYSSFIVSLALNGPF